MSNQLLKVSGRVLRKQIDPRKAQLRTDYDGIEFFNRGMGRTIRYNEQRIVSDLNISNLEHTERMRFFKRYLELTHPEYNDLDGKDTEAMIRYHDIGEVGSTKDIVAGLKKEIDELNEAERAAYNISQLPPQMREEAAEAVSRYNAAKKPGARLDPKALYVNTLDKFDGSATTATPNGLRTNRINNAKLGRIGEAFINFQKNYNLGEILKSRNRGFPEIANIWEVGVWEKLIELGVLKYGPEIYAELIELGIIEKADEYKPMKQIEFPFEVETTKER